jgi:hypothetical protein
MGKSESPLISMLLDSLPVVFLCVSFLMFWYLLSCLGNDLYDARIRIIYLESQIKKDKNENELKRWWRDYDKELFRGYQPVGKPLQKGELPPLPRGGSAESGRRQHWNEGDDW